MCHGFKLILQLKPFPYPLGMQPCLWKLKNSVEIEVTAYSVISNASEIVGKIVRNGEFSSEKIRFETLLERLRCYHITVQQ